MKAWDGSLPLPASCSKPERADTRRAAVALHSLIPQPPGRVGKVWRGRGRGRRAAGTLLLSEGNQQRLNLMTV